MDMNLSLIPCHLSSSLFVYLLWPTSHIIWLLCLALQLDNLPSQPPPYQLTSLVFLWATFSFFFFCLFSPKVSFSCLGKHVEHFVRFNSQATSLFMAYKPPRFVLAIKCWRHSAEVSKINSDAGQISWNLAYNSMA